jgi:hypothetical protein
MATEDTTLIKFIDSEQVKQDLIFDIADINGAMQKHAAMYVHYAGVSVRARTQWDVWKQRLEILEGQLDGIYRTALKEENPKTTESQIRSAVVNDEKWKLYSSRVIGSNTQFRLAEGVERSFEHRKDMLLQVARNLAREQEGPMRVMANQNAGDARQRLLDSMSKGA